MQELDMPVNMRAIIGKLPFKVREQRRTMAHDIMKRTNHRVHFEDLVTFIERRVSILSDPLFGNIQDSPPDVAGTKTLTRFKSQPRNRITGNIVATTVTSRHLSERVKELTLPPGKERKAGCLCCARSHPLEECKQFSGRKHKEKIYFLSLLCMSRSWSHEQGL